VIMRECSLIHELVKIYIGPIPINHLDQYVAQHDPHEIARPITLTDLCHIMAANVGFNSRFSLCSKVGEKKHGYQELKNRQYVYPDFCLEAFQPFFAEVGKSDEKVYQPLGYYVENVHYLVTPKLPNTDVRRTATNEVSDMTEGGNDNQQPQSHSLSCVGRQAMPKATMVSTGKKDESTNPVSRAFGYLCSSIGRAHHTNVTPSSVPVARRGKFDKRHPNDSIKRQLDDELKQASSGGRSDALCDFMRQAEKCGKKHPTLGHDDPPDEEKEGAMTGGYHHNIHHHNITHHEVQDNQEDFPESDSPHDPYDNEKGDAMAKDNSNIEETTPLPDPNTPEWRTFLHNLLPGYQHGQLTGEDIQQMLPYLHLYARYKKNRVTVEEMMHLTPHLHLFLPYARTVSPPHETPAFHPAEIQPAARPGGSTPPPPPAPTNQDEADLAPEHGPAPPPAGEEHDNVGQDGAAPKEQEEESPAPPSHAAAPRQRFKKQVAPTAATDRPKRTSRPTQLLLNEQDVGGMGTKRKRRGPKTGAGRKKRRHVDKVEREREIWMDVAHTLEGCCMPDKMLQVIKDAALSANNMDEFCEHLFDEAGKLGDHMDIEDV